MSRVYESNGPDVKIRGNPAHIAEKYMQLARDAHTSGDPVSAENYYQHAEHYYRLIAAAQEQFRQNNPHLARPESELPGGARDDVFEDGDDDTMSQQPMSNASPSDPAYEPQPYMPRDSQPFVQQPNFAPRQQHSSSYQGDVERLPSFITGGGGQPQPQPQQGAQGNQSFQGQPNQGGYTQNGHDNQGDRFPLHRRRRRHRGNGPRQETQGGPQQDGDSGSDSSPQE